MTTSTAFYFAYYELSEFWTPFSRQNFLYHCRQLEDTCRDLGIDQRNINELKLSHYILILDYAGPSDEVLYQCLEFLCDSGIIDYNPIKSVVEGTNKSTN